VAASGPPDFGLQNSGARSGGGLESEDPEWKFTGNSRQFLLAAARPLW